jgi:hypothetical protein
MVDCTTRGKYRWTHINRDKSTLVLPQKCEDCEEVQRQTCIEKSWAGQGKNPKDLDTNVVINFNQDCDTKIERTDEEPIDNEFIP